MLCIHRFLCLRPNTPFKRQINDKVIFLLPRSGRPNILNEVDYAKFRQKIRKEPRVTYDDLLAEVSNKCKKDSITRLLTIQGLKKMASYEATLLETQPCRKTTSVGSTL